MKNIIKYLKWIPFAICFSSLILYIICNIRIKLNPFVVVTDSTINVLKTYLIIALISAFLGLLFILISKIYNLVKSDNYIQNNKNVKRNNKIIESKKIESNEKITTKENKNLISCKECGKSISKDAAICPYCGILYDKKVLKSLYKDVDKKDSIKLDFTLFKFIINLLIIVISLILIVFMSKKLIDTALENRRNVNFTIENKN